jgi:hypothetical protein
MSQLSEGFDRLARERREHSRVDVAPFITGRSLEVLLALTVAQERFDQQLSAADVSARMDMPILEARDHLRALRAEGLFNPGEGDRWEFSFSAQALLELARTGSFDIETLEQDEDLAEDIEGNQPSLGL